MNFCRTWMFYPSHSVVYGLSFRLYRKNSSYMAARLWRSIWDVVTERA
jgi:hypothetical protein